MEIKKNSLNILIWNIWWGKSHFIKKFWLEKYVVSPDEIRKKFFNELFFINNNELNFWSFYSWIDDQAWEIVKKIVIERIINWLPVFVDATFVKEKTRKWFMISILDEIKEKDKKLFKELELNYFIFNNTLENSLNNNENRFNNNWHFIDKKIIEKKQKELRETIKKLKNDNENFSFWQDKKEVNNIFFVFDNEEKQEYKFEKIEIINSDYFLIDKNKEDFKNKKIIILWWFYWDSKYFEEIIKNFSDEKTLEIDKNVFFIFNWDLFWEKINENLDILKLMYKIIKINKQGIINYSFKDREYIQALEVYYKNILSNEKFFNLSAEERQNLEKQFNNFSSETLFKLDKIWNNEEDLKTIKNILSLTKTLFWKNEFNTKYTLIISNKTKDKWDNWIIISNQQIIDFDLNNLPYILLNKDWKKGNLIIDEKIKKILKKKYWKFYFNISNILENNFNILNKWIYNDFIWYWKFLILD